MKLSLIPCRLSWTAYSIYSQLRSVSDDLFQLQFEDVTRDTVNMKEIKEPRRLRGLFSENAVRNK